MKTGIWMCVLLIGGLTVVAAAQQPVKKSGAAAEETSIALYKKTISVKYVSAPMKGPLKKAWPLGGTSPATLYTEGDLVFKGLVVPKGTYSLYLLADADKWQLIINKNMGPKAATYDSGLDVGRVPMILRNSSAPVEACKVTLSKFAARAARLELALDSTVASVPFTLDWVPGDPEW